VRHLLVTAGVVPSSPILVTLMKKALSSSETSVLTRATRRNIPEDTILHSHRRENLKSYNLTLINGHTNRQVEYVNTEKASKKLFLYLQHGSNNPAALSMKI
jgi:hypothetical protein